MNLNDRKSLKTRFQNDKYLSASDFETLINSMLNKFEDKFHGKWEKGRTYCTGDVVFYFQEKKEDNKTNIENCNFWMMKSNQCICGEQPPPTDRMRWMPFPDDDDWVMLPAQGVMWAKVFDRVGIGVGYETGNYTQGDRPQARLDVRKIGCPSNEETAPPQPSDENSKDSTTAAMISPARPSSTGKGEGRWLLFPQGATQTQATLLHYDGEIQKDMGTVQESGSSTIPQPLQYQSERLSYFTTGLSLTEMTWCSDAARGFVFRQGQPGLQETSALNLDPTMGTVMMVVQPRVTQKENVPNLACLGLNVDQPAAVLDITDPQRGHLYFLPESATDPTLHLLRPETGENLTVGIGESHAVLFTDTPSGFQFKGSIPRSVPVSENPADALDINTGRVLVNISPEGNGRVGIGCVPRDYEIDVRGIVQTRAVYQDTNADQIRNVKPLNSTLSKLQCLRPITFEWNRDTEIASPDAANLPEPEPQLESQLQPQSQLESQLESQPQPQQQPQSTAKNGKDSHQSSNQQIGLLAHEVERFFPEVVRTANDGTQSVAYTNLVPVLIQAIQDLDRQHQLELRRLEKFTGLLANRIALLVILLFGSWAIAFVNYLFF